MNSFRFPLFAFFVLISNAAFAGNLKVNLAPSQAVSAGAQWRVDGGVWRNSGVTVKNLTNASHTIEYKVVTGWLAPASATVTLTNNVTTTVTGTYVLPASLAVTLSPSTGQWRVDGGVWRNSGTTATGLTPGAHTISYNALANYIAPATETVTLVSGQTTSVARNYTASSNLTINLTPSNGSWQIDGGAWQPSGTTLSGLTPGAHTINYSALANHIAPATESVTLVSGQTTNISRSYTATSNLTVTLTPSSGFWKLDGVGNWRESGTTATGLTPGNHTITYTGLSAMLSPPDETVALVAGENSLARSYTPAGKIFMMLNPNTAQWRVDGGAWLATHTYSGWIAAGSHTIEYSPVSPYLTPPPETVTVAAGQYLSLSRVYTNESALIVNLTPAVGQWRIDGGPWQNSGTRVGQLTQGNHTVEYSDVSGYFAPGSETIFLSSGTDRTIARSYLRPGAVTVNVVPSEGQWRLNNGEWQASGATLSGLRPGFYPIQFTSVPGWFDVPDFYAVSVAEDQTTTFTYTHVRHASITTTLAPGAGQWRVNGGVWQPSGATVGALSSGNYVVDYSTIPGFTPLPSETIALAAGEQKSINRTYSGTSSLTVTLNPSSASWSVNGGPWRNSGTTASGLPPGAHTVSYRTLENHLTPPSETITLDLDEAASLTRSYTPAGQIVVTLSPGTAQWRLDGGEWLATATYSGLIPAGPHTIEYSSLPNMLTPAPETVTLLAGQTLLISKTYTGESALIVDLTPAGVGQWRIDGGAWQNSGTRVGQLTQGNHTVEYKAAAGYFPPGSETVFLNGTETTIARSYLRFGALTVNVEPAEGQWRLINGTWRASGDTISYLKPGFYAIQFSRVPGWFDLPERLVTVEEGQTTTVTYAHVRHASITATLAPGTGQWRVNGGAWQPSGATVGALSSGNYLIDYSIVPGFTPLPSETIPLAAGEQKSITRSYDGNASLTVTLSPSSGTWSVDGGPWRNSGTTASGLTSGSHTISYQAVANHLSPPAETITLGLGETASFARSYTPAGQILVTLVPGIAQWRVDGGEWRATGTSSGLIAAGSHTIEYSTVENYMAPPTETVTLAGGQTLAISKSYTADFGASLEVKTIPAYLSETGAVQWRLDGGNWNTTGAPVSVSPGTHTLEFEPVAGLDVPAASSITISAGATETIEATFYLTHRLRFFLHPDLVAGLSTEDLQARLSQYAAHLQTIWHRESLRRLTFDPATDISIVSDTPFSGNAFPPLPEYGFELWAYADSSNGSIYGSNGGVGGLDVTGAGGADGMHWTQVYDPATLAPGSTELYEYWKQIDTIIHEFEHTFGAGLGEYYGTGGFDDLSGVPPFYDVDYFAPADPFWNSHADFWGDPLLRYAWDNYRIGNPTSLPALLDAVRFSATSRGIIDGCYRNADMPFTGNSRTTLPDLSRIQISVVDATTGQPIPGATLRVWNRPNPGPMSGQERVVVPTAAPGVFEFHWTSDSASTPLNNWDNSKLLKAFASGYQPKAQWEWIYDAQRVKTVDNVDVWEITVALDPAP